MEHCVAELVGCIHPNFGPMEQLLTDVVRGLPVVRSASSSLPWQWVPWFPEVPLNDLANITQYPGFNRPRLRQLLMKRSREFSESSSTSIDREIEQEIEAELIELREQVDLQKQRYGRVATQEAWTAARVPRGGSQSGTSSLPRSPWIPFLRVGQLGYEWQVGRLSKLLDVKDANSSKTPDQSKYAGERLASENTGPGRLLVKE